MTDYPAASVGRELLNMHDEAQSLLGAPKAADQISKASGKLTPAQDAAQNVHIKRKPLREAHNLPLTPALSNASSSLSADLDFTKGPGSTSTLALTNDGDEQQQCAWHSGAASGRKGISPPTTKLWDPFWLQTSTLIGLMVLFAIYMVALILLWHFSNLNHGFGIREATSQYTYTYAPTAALILLVGCWRQVDYYSKVLAPWEHMRKGDAEVTESLLLDYISPIQLASLVSAVKRRDFVVVSTILGFLLLKLIVVSSTGLLSLTPILLETPDFSLVATTRLSESLNSSNISVTNSPVYTYYGSMTYGLPFPRGSANGIAFPSIEPNINTPESAIVRTEVDAFVPQFDCEDVTVSNIRYPATSNYSYSSSSVLEATIETPSCRFNRDLSLVVPNGQMGGLPPRRWTPLLIPIECDTHTVSDICAAYYNGSWRAWPGEPCYFSPSRLYHYPSNFSSDYIRWLFVMHDISYVQTFSNSLPESVHNTTPHLNGFAAVLCRPSYSIERINLTFEDTRISTQNGIKFNLPDTVSNKSILGLSNGNLSMLVLSSLKHSSILEGPQSYSAESSPEADLPDTVFKIMAQVGNTSNYSSLLDVHVMAISARHVFTNIAAQVAREYLMVPGANRLQGHVTYIQDRLIVQEMSLWTMVAAFTVLGILTGFVLLKRPREVVPRDPDPIGGITTFLIMSESLQNLLAKSGHFDTKTIRARLKDFRYSIHSIPEFRIQANGEIHNEKAVSSRLPDHYWRPVVIRKLVVIAILVVPPAFIIILEILQRISDRYNGFLSGPNSLKQDLISKIYTTYIPALMMLVIATLFNSLDFTVSTFAPFSALRKGNARVNRSILSHLVGIMPTRALLTSLRSHHWGAFCSILAGLLGSTLTVVVSGLYIIDRVSTTETIALHRLDSFNSSWPDSSHGDRSAALTLRFVEHSNMSFPTLTFDGLAFPNVSLGPSAMNLSAATLITDLPAWRASLNCQTVPASRINMSYYDDDPGEFRILANLSYPSSCGFTSKVTSEYLIISKYSESLVHDSYFGVLRDMFTTSNPTAEKEAGPCPSLLVFFGTRAGIEASIKDITVLTCSQHLEKVITKTKFTPPEFLIDLKEPPRPEESTTRYIENVIDGGFTFSFIVADYINRELSKSNGLMPGSDITEDGRDAFFAALVNGKDGIPAEELGGPQNIDRLINATTHLYQKYMAQAISLNMRTTNDSSALGETFNATILGATLRLKQNPGSKLILQILLGVMSVCGGAAYLFTDMRYTLPHNPYTIAGTMSLLAGSEMLKIIPEGAAYMSDKELNEKVYGKHRYGMGWFDDGEGGMRFGIDIGKAHIVRRRDEKKWIGWLSDFFRRSES